MKAVAFNINPVQCLLCRIPYRAFPQFIFDSQKMFYLAHRKTSNSWRTCTGSGRAAPDAQARTLSPGKLNRHCDSPDGGERFSRLEHTQAKPVVECVSRTRVRLDGNTTPRCRCRQGISREYLEELVIRVHEHCNLRAPSRRRQLDTCETVRVEDQVGEASIHLDTVNSMRRAEIERCASYAHGRRERYESIVREKIRPSGEPQNIRIDQVGTDGKVRMV